MSGPNLKDIQRFTTITTTLQDGVAANGNGAVAALQSYDGSETILIGNGAGTCTVTVQGTMTDPTASPAPTAQDTAVLGLVLLWDSGRGTNLARALVSGQVAVAANTSYLYAIEDVMPYVQCPISAASGLGAGTSDTGCTVILTANTL